MEIISAVASLSALAQESRLTVFRLLVKAGPEGLAAGEIARALATPANTLSAQLNILTACGLLAGRREGRRILYAAQYKRMGDLLVFLTEDCCQGRCGVCSPLGVETACADRKTTTGKERP
ncbi:MAG: ArsR/SmtB family transcription factor [Caulobacteraceae bacterium]